MKSLKKLLLQFKNHNLSYALITIGFISMVVIQFTRIFVNRTGIILTLIVLIMFFIGILLRTSNLKNLSLKQKLLHWAPRILVTLFGLFFSLLLMSVSAQSFTTPEIWEIGLSLFICFVPACFVLATSFRGFGIGSAGLSSY